MAEDALKARYAPMPLKTVVALNLVEVAGGRNIVAERYRDHMLRLYQEIDNTLGGIADAHLTLRP